MEAVQIEDSGYLNVVLVNNISTSSLGGLSKSDFFQTVIPLVSRLQGHFAKLKKERTRHDVRKFSISQELVNRLNGLPANVTAAQNEGIQKQPICLPRWSQDQLKNRQLNFYSVGSQ